MRWVEHIARIGSRGMHTGSEWENQEERDQEADQDVGDLIILK
jgi:hypothetical protein